MHSSSMKSSSDKRLFEAFDSPFSVRKCARICFASFDFLIDSEKCLIFEALINCLVLFRYFYIRSIVFVMTIVS